MTFATVLARVVRVNHHGTPQRGEIAVDWSRIADAEQAFAIACEVFEIASAASSPGQALDKPRRL
ncbi:MAG: hypothetical protein IPJ18_05245 [Betaproteobacteria bacterium]|nr:hypothetical protein [Betaproteobacteria bacterium]